LRRIKTQLFHLVGLISLLSSWLSMLFVSGMHGETNIKLLIVAENSSEN
jgi:uncharacterized membrane protein